MYSFLEALSKKIQVQMSDEYHAVLKAYAGFMGKSLGSVLFMFTKQELHHQSRHCKFVDGLLKAQQVQLDKRINKPCWGWKCMACAHLSMCMIGKNENLFEPSDKAKSYLKETSEFFD